MKTPIRSIFFFAITIGLLSCSGNRPANYYNFRGFALGTTYSITVESKDTSGIAGAMEKVFEVANNSLSVYNPNSLLNRINRNETDTVDEHIAYCIETAAEVSRISGGVYDITIKPLTDAWGFTDKEPTFRPDTDSLLRYVGYEKIKIEKGRLIKDDPAIQVELNSIAKGYIVDLMGRMIETFSTGNYLVEIGGEVVCKGLNGKGNEWNIWIDKPSEGNMIPGKYLQAILRFTDMGMATSGNNRRFYTDADGNKVVHTINARTGESRPSNLLSATVLAENCTIADAWGTMLMAAGLERSLEILGGHPEIMAYLVYSGENGRFLVYATDNMKPHIVKEDI